MGKTIPEQTLPTRGAFVYHPKLRNMEEEQDEPIVMSCQVCGEVIMMSANIKGAKDLEHCGEPMVEAE